MVSSLTVHGLNRMSLTSFIDSRLTTVPDVFLWSRLPVKKINYFDLVSRGQMMGKIVKTTPSLRMKGLLEKLGANAVFS